MKSIIIASNCSGGGKTTFTLGLMKSLKNRDFDVQGYKVGPDYIDTAFHKEVTGKASRNLDSFLIGKKHVRESYFNGQGHIGIIEGVMGLYDGIGISEEASTYDISRILDNMPIILVLSPKGQSSTICAEINGIRDYKNANIVGVVLNSVSKKYYKLLKAAIEKNCNIKVFGYIPKDEKIRLNSRHLGLVQSIEIEDIREKIEYCSELLEEHVNIDGIIEEMKEISNSDKSDYEISDLKNQNINIAIAYDKAFNFYYRDNIDILEKLGKIIYFSPIKDRELPKNIDFLYIGGGYPEIFKKELESNKTMRLSVNKALNNGLKCYAECGGLMYLTDEIDGAKMVGFFNGNSEMTSKLQRFGYCKVTIDEKYFNKKLSINAHEFHKSIVNLKEENVYKVEKNNFDNETLTWKCGYKKKNTLGGYAHVNFLGNIDFIKALIDYKNKEW